MILLTLIIMNEKPVKRFKTIEEAEQWARDNDVYCGSGLRVVEGRTVKFIEHKPTVDIRVELEGCFLDNRVLPKRLLR